MVLILASRYDTGALELAQHWGAARARILTAAHLAESEWRWDPTGGSRSLPVGGRRDSLTRVDGILNRLPAVTAGELPHIDLGDRAYVAAELTAFLAVWLRDFPGPVLNRPSPLLLAGPAWPPERWQLEAHQAGLPTTATFNLQPTDPVTPGDPTPLADGWMTVVGDRCFGLRWEPFEPAVRRLASRAGVQLLSAGFSRSGGIPQFQNACLTPELTLPEVRDAVLRRLRTDSP